MLFIASLLSGCSSAPTQKEVVNETVFQCKALCNGGQVDYINIKGLRCICQNQRQAANVTIPIYNNNSYPTSIPAPYIIHETVYEKNNLTRRKKNVKIKDNAAVIKVNGRIIISQIK